MPQPPIRADQVRVLPANEATWRDLVAVFGTVDYPARCQCQRFKVEGWIWRDSSQDERTAALRAQTRCGQPGAAATSGLVAYLDEPAGWVAEGYPMETEPGKEVTWGETHVGTVQVFRGRRVPGGHPPDARRHVMRIDLS